MAEEADDERPLDMTVNRRSSPPPYRYPSPSDYSGRPSVITCASTSSVRSSPGCASPCGSTGSARSSSNLSPRPSADAPGDGARPAHRREIISSGSSETKSRLKKRPCGKAWAALRFGVLSRPPFVMAAQTFNYLARDTCTAERREGLENAERRSRRREKERERKRGKTDPPLSFPPSRLVPGAR